MTEPISRLFALLNVKRSSRKRQVSPSRLSRLRTESAGSRKERSLAGPGFSCSAEKIPFGIVFLIACISGCGNDQSTTNAAGGATSGVTGGSSTGGASTRSSSTVGGTSTQGGTTGSAKGGSTQSSTLEGGNASTVGGKSSSGGSPASGGASSGGASSANGGRSSGGSAVGSAQGGSSPTTVAACNAATACSSPSVRVTEIDVGANVVVNEDDAALRLLSISPIPSGGSRLAWMDNASGIHVTTLDACDNIDPAVPSFKIDGFDYGDILADNAGGVLLVTRAAKGSAATKYCGTITNLCGNASSLPTQYSCWDMYLVRFDGTTESWATQLSKSSTDHPPYMNSPTDTSDVYYIWQAYAHHGRLASDGTNYAGYYGAAVSIGNQKCSQTDSTNTNGVDIHQGDEMQVVGPSGELLTGHNSFAWGCSHSGFEKIVWDPSASRFVMICRSDTYPKVGLNVNASSLVYAIDKANSSVSNLVLAQGGGYWVLVSDTSANKLMLLKFTTGAATSNVDLGTGTKPHLVRYGSRMLASWNTGSSMVGQILDASTGATLGSSFAIGVSNNQFADFRDYSDGSVAFPAIGSAATKIKIARVLACNE